MTFDELLAQVLDLLQREGRVSYRALKRRYGLDDDYLEDLKAEIITGQTAGDGRGWGCAGLGRGRSDSLGLGRGDHDTVSAAARQDRVV